MSVVPVFQFDIPNSPVIQIKHHKSKSFKPTPTVKLTSILFTFLGLAFIIYGSVLISYSSSIQEYKITNYDLFQNCSVDTSALPGNTCKIPLKLTSSLTPPIYFYYQLSNLFQNHRQYIKSKSMSQLSGKSISSDLANRDCFPAVSMSDLNLSKETLNYLSNKYRLNVNWTDDLVKITNVAHPCGEVAKTFFNDSFSLYLSDGSNVHIDQTSIAWDSDKELFQHPPGGSLPWIDVTDEHFIVWMRTSGLPNFKKLWGRIRDKLGPGDYYINITNNYPVHQFSGHKSIILTTANSLGGNNYYLGVGHLVIGGVIFPVSLGFAFRAFFLKKKDDLNKIN